MKLHPVLYSITQHLWQSAFAINLVVIMKSYTKAVSMIRTVPRAVHRVYVPRM